MIMIMMMIVMMIVMVYFVSHKLVPLNRNWRGSMELLAFPKTFRSPILHLLITTTSTTTTIRPITKYNYTIATAFYALEKGGRRAKVGRKPYLTRGKANRDSNVSLNLWRRLLSSMCLISACFFSLFLFFFFNTVMYCTVLYCMWFIFCFVVIFPFRKRKENMTFVVISTCRWLPGCLCPRKSHSEYLANIAQATS